MVVETSSIAFNANAVVALERVAARSTMSVLAVVAHWVHVWVISAGSNWFHHSHSAADDYDLWLHSVSHLRSDYCHSHWLTVAGLLHILLRLGHSVSLLLRILLRVLRLHWLLHLGLLVAHLLLRIAHRLLHLLLHWLLHWLLVAHLLLGICHLLLLRVVDRLLHLYLDLGLHRLNSQKLDNLHIRSRFEVLLCWLTTRR